MISTESAVAAIAQKVPRIPGSLATKISSAADGAQDALANGALVAQSTGAAGAQWKLTRRDRVCSQCANPFGSGALVFSSLAIVNENAETTQFQRVDRCGACYQKRRAGRHEIVWRTQHEEAPKRRRVDLVSLMEVFAQLVTSGDGRVRELTFLVALLLLRHRRMRIVRTRSEGDRDFLVMAVGRTKQMVEVEVADLSKERMEALRGQLTAVFDGRELPVALITNNADSTESAQPAAPADASAAVAAVS